MKLRERPERYTCLCSRCLLDFGSESAFDYHQTGNPAYDFSPTDPDKADGFRCLAPDELKAKGMHQDKLGRWRRTGTTPNPHVTGEPPQPALWGATRAA